MNLFYIFQNRISKRRSKFRDYAQFDYNSFGNEYLKQALDESRLISNVKSNAISDKFSVAEPNWPYERSIINFLL